MVEDNFFSKKSNIPTIQYSNIADEKCPIKIV
jgi:hypothetical protein